VLARRERRPRPLAWAHGDRSQAILEPLTVRETEVPAHLADFLNTEQIAQTMFVSLNTVRTHIRSILRKLGVVSRQNEAFRAWDLALLPLRSPALALGEGL